MTCSPDERHYQAGIPFYPIPGTYGVESEHPPKEVIVDSFDGRESRARWVEEPTTGVMLPIIQNNGPADFKDLTAKAKQTRGGLSRIERMAKKNSKLPGTTLYKCRACKKKESKMLRCSQCKNAYYCNTGCQRSHWPTHKKVCQ